MVPEGFKRRMRALLGVEYDALEAAWERPRSAALRLNPRKPLPPAALAALGAEPVPWAAGGYYYNPALRPGLSPFHDAGAYYLQEASAMAPAGLLDVRPGMRVLDLCAAPGGKSFQLAAALEGTGLLVSNEIDPKRAAVLSRNMERMGVANALVLNEHPARLAERFPNGFDRVLVDAPCSGEGMFRREEAAAAAWSERQILACARRQREILESAAKTLRPGGRLVYSTCTFAPEENEGTVSAFLKSRPDFHIRRLDAPCFSPGRPDWTDSPDPALSYAVRLWPHVLRGEGHFAAVLERDGEGSSSLGPGEAGVPEPKELTEFRATLNAMVPEGRLLFFGNSLYLSPEGLPALRGLRTLRPGLQLGEVKKGRFEPAHAWALWLRDCASTAAFPADGQEVANYLAGAPVEGQQRGWTLLTASGLSLGWVKGSGGVLKNHLPKGLRRMVKTGET